MMKKKTKPKLTLGQELIRALKECIAYMESQERVPALPYLYALNALDRVKKLK